MRALVKPPRGGCDECPMLEHCRALVNTPAPLACELTDAEAGIDSVERLPGTDAVKDVGVPGVELERAA